VVLAGRASRGLPFGRTSPFESARLRQLALGLAAGLAVVALAVPLLVAGPAPLTSDESLYLAEAYNIAEGRGATYTSGDIVNHRPPLFPALLAAPIKATGGDPSSAYFVPKIVALALVVAAFLLARQLFGPLAGALAAFFVASSAFLRWLGTTLFLDGTETLFLLLALSALWQAFRSERAAWFALSGLLFGAAFLTKEAAVQWLPLPFAFALLGDRWRERRVVAGLAAYAAGAGVALAFWWTWVFAATGRVYFWGPPDARLAVALAAAGAAIGAIALVLFALRSRARVAAAARVSRAAAIAGLLLWTAAIFAFLELTSWPFPAGHLHTVPSYVWHVAAPNSQPWPLVALGAAWLVLRARDDERARLLALGLVLFLPFALFAANRSFSYRDLLPMLLLAYVGAAGLSAVALRWASERIGTAAVTLATVAVATVFGIAQTGELVEARILAPLATPQDDWDNPVVHDAAAWIDGNVPPGAGIMSGRLYFSHLYLLNDARSPVYQLPTLRVEVDPAAPQLIRRETTLFRWEDHRMLAPAEDERWLYVRRYPVKHYYVALSERDLLHELRERSADYLVLTGEDAGFSSFTYLDYFANNPAFDLVYRDRRGLNDGVYIFRVDRARLAPRPYRAVVSTETIEALAVATGLSEAEVGARIDPDGITVRPEAR
jgi:4-amino-4-deoxy-L-arabinose transferase-like glycosyltransferase